MTEPMSETYESQRVTLHYNIWGDGSKPPMMLIHGGQDHSRNWDFVAERLADRYTIYAPDLRGHGDSGWAIGGMYSIPEFTLDVANLADRIEGPLTVIGHSLGGAIALQYAGTIPERVDKLISIEGWGPPEMPHVLAHRRMREWIEHMNDVERRQPRRYPSLEEATNRMMEANPHLKPEMAHHLTEHGANRNEDGTYSWKFDNYVRIRSPYVFNIEDAMIIWSQIACPTLLIKGAESWAVDPDKTGRADVIKGHETVVIEKAGHWVHHDQLDVFMSHVERFLAS
ncbi:MAG TPA: alpha/beta hydrolase [Dehalococcoidia bacterium]|nr:alpha/beta hydrolase [Dehalococcoidia bacterium]